MSRNTISSEPVVLVQQIVVTWTKASRGSPGSIARNAVPDVALLPADLGKPCGARLVCHQLRYHERSDFLAPVESVTTDDREEVVLGCVIVQAGDPPIRVNYAYDRTSGGMPERGWDRKSFDLEEHDWIRIAYNGRFHVRLGTAGPENMWYYQKFVFNVGLFSTWRPSVFLDQAPKARYELLGHLF